MDKEYDVHFWFKLGGRPGIQGLDWLAIKFLPSRIDDEDRYIRTFLIVINKRRCTIIAHEELLQIIAQLKKFVVEIVRWNSSVSY